MEIQDILAEVRKHQVCQVCVTGGEPLAQPDCLQLLTLLADADYDVSLETSGALDISQVDSRIGRVMDIKTPDSGEEDSNRWDNLQYLDDHDEIKFVIASRRDYEWACDVIQKRQLDTFCDILMSPVQGLLEARQLAEWILADHLPVRFQIQLHKLLWGNMRGK